MARLQGPSRARAIQQALQEANKPLTFDELFHAARRIFPMDANSLKAGWSNLAHSYSEGARLLQRTADGRYVWLPALLNGTLYRHTLGEEELKKHYLALETEIIAALWLDQVGWGLEKNGKFWRLLLPDETPIVLKPELLSYSESGLSIYGVRGEPALWAWLEQQNARPGDALILKIENVSNQQCRALFARRTDRDEVLIAQRNNALADAIYTVCKPRQSGIYLTDLCPKVIALGIYHHMCPPDSVETIVNNDSRFMWDRDQIKLATRADHLYAAVGLRESDIFDLFDDKPRLPSRKRPPKKDLKARVYLFKASFLHSKTIWRRIEIRGDQTLGELDDAMRTAFRHDHSDHLSEFYLGIDREAHRRGLGTIEPGGGGAGSEWIVGELGLEPSDVLSYTYDFGDNIQHILKLEQIGLSEPRIKYPRIVEQNKPRYYYCEHCKAEGKKEIATWICIDCSNKQQRQVLVCEEHIASEHEDHYAEAMVY
ncbi:MAG: hypothetical protein AB1817_18080 [Chloroflexota bacterium]